MQISERTVSTPAKSGKIEALDFVRAVCAVGIIIYHISCYTASDAHKVLYAHANGGYGGLIVGIFLLISGGVLYYNYPRTPSLGVFYYKRWKAIFPMFYVTWLHCYIQSVFQTGAPFWKGKWVLLLSALGMDGYFYYRFDTYYAIGEWFMGAIVFLYLLYPLYAVLVNKFHWAVLLALVPLWLWQIHTDFFVISGSRNLIYCSLLFVSGMLIFRYALYRNIFLRIISFVVSGVLLRVPIPGYDDYKELLLILSMFFVLFTIGEFVMKWKPAGKVFAMVGGLSFPIFLVQNRIGGKLVNGFAPISQLGVWKTIIVAVVLCVAYAWCVKVIANGILRTGWYQKMETFLLSKIGGKNGTNHS